MTSYLLQCIPFFFGICAVLVFAELIKVYNGLIQLKNQIERAFANIDVILKQRHDEIPQIVSICEQFAKYERATIDRVVNARKQYSQARSVNDKIEAGKEMSQALTNVVAIGEAYPELKSNQQFLQLQQRISGLESQIADRREMYNEEVTNYNTRIIQIPDLFVAQMLNYRPYSLYKIADSEREVPSLRMNLPAA